MGLNAHSSPLPPCRYCTLYLPFLFCLSPYFLFCSISDCCCSITKSCRTLCNPWTAAHQAPLSFTISWNLLKLMSIESVMLSHHLILYSFFGPQSFPASGSFSVSWLFASGGQRINLILKLTSQRHPEECLTKHLDTMALPS